MTAPALLWFRRDLRIDDNPALTAAVRHGGPVILIFILDRDGEGEWPRVARAAGGSIIRSPPWPMRWRCAAAS